MSKILIAALVVVFAVGCGSKGTTVVSSDGGKVASDGSGNMTITDKEGNKVDYSADKDGSWSAKTSKGEEIQANKDGMTMTNEKGEVSSMSTSAVTEAELGLPFYPGSAPLKDRDMKINADGKQTYLSARSTSDSPEKVVEFFKSKVKTASSTSAEKFGSVIGKLEDGRDVNLMAMVKDDGTTEVQISVSGKK